MASQSVGIQQLLSAEKRAAEKVTEARKRKAKRLKEAKEEAQAEIESYRSQREFEYKKHESTIMGSRGDMEQQIEESTRRKIDELQTNLRQNKDTAIQKLLAHVFDIQPQVHKNYRM